MKKLAGSIKVSRSAGWILPILLTALLCVVNFARAEVEQEPLPENVVLVTVDGVRWQELFRGPDRALLDPDRDRGWLNLLEREPTPEGRRAGLMPYLWKDLIPRGVAIGNRDLGSRMEVKNPHRFSYPGYAELLRGKPVPGIDSNVRRFSPSETVLQFVRRNLRLSYAEVAAYASWDVFEFICRDGNSPLFVSAGVNWVEPLMRTPEMAGIERRQFAALTPWDSVRHDAFTAQMALIHLEQYRPRLLYIALDETDDWGHEGRYDRVLRSLQSYDRLLRDLWNTLQSLETHRDRTTLLVTTDHGRGYGEGDWTDHGADVRGAEETWMIAIGPRTPDRGELRAHPPVHLADIAATLLELLGLDPQEFNPEAGPPIESVLK